MNLDILTLAFISCLVFLAQVVALLLQYLGDKSIKGVSWWLLGVSFMALGVILMPMVASPTLSMLARLANPLTVAGQILLYIGVIRFFNKKENRRILFSIFVGFLIFYYYFMYAYNEISGRGLVLTVTLAIISFMTAASLLANKDRLAPGSANFTAIVFFSYGCFILVRIYKILISPPIVDYYEQTTMLQLSFIVPIITSLLWTFGFTFLVNQRLSAENREEKEKLQLIFNTSPDAAIISRLVDGTIVDVNAGFLIMSGYPRSELIQNSTIKINVWHNLEDREIFVKALKANGICENLEFDFQRKDGSLLTGSISARVITIQSIPHIVSVVHDITKNKQAEEAMRESEALYRSILNASPDDITITDMKGSILVISPAAKKMFGYEPDFDRFVGTQLVDYIIPEDRGRARLNIVRMCKGEYSGPNEYHGVRKDGSTFDIEVNSGLIRGVNQQPEKMVFMVRDITGRKQAEQQIQELVQQLEMEKKTAQNNANTDSLTGLANRRYFDEALNKEFRRSKRSGASLSLIMLDVDHFKKFNDSYGHLAGDGCLEQIGKLLKTLVRRKTDIVARYGGEEFIVILTETDQSGAETFAERIRKGVEALAIPHAASGLSNNVTVSLGVVTIYPAGLESPEQIVKLADEAMYCAKKGGRNRISGTTASAIIANIPTS